MSTRSLLVLSLATSALLLTAAPRAHACSPLPPGVLSTIPVDGGSYPGNAAVMLQGQGIDTTAATVTVDGQPATLKDVSKERFSEVGYLGVTVEPTPKAGQAVVITGSFCNPAAGCKDVSLHYQATAPDTVAPPPIELLSYSIYDYKDYKSSGGDCQSDSDFAWWLKLQVDVPAALDESPLIYAVERYDDASESNPPVFAASGYVSASWNSTVTIRSTANNLQGKALPEAFCFRVKAYDTAGNKPSTSALLCKPCNYRVDNTPSDNFAPAEPMWTAADVFGGGTCDSTMTGSSASTGTGSGGSGGGGTNDVVIDGCGCRMVGESDRPAGLFGALALGLMASLRIARRRR